MFNFFLEDGQYPKTWKNPSDLQEEENKIPCFPFEGNYKDYVDLLEEFGLGGEEDTEKIN